MPELSDDSFEKWIGGVLYLFKRLYHPELPLTYHVHTHTGHRPRVFRIQRSGTEWKFLSFRQVPAAAILHKNDLIAAVTEYEQMLATRRDK
ncbi:MAG: hypothetical protein EOO16_07305 [Chitinophagaceae bacterium]|nr:MAG: hypothetical protein EOO16_07305 [Chitinophagaceae bacterium]